MAYKTVRRNGRNVLINTLTGKEVRPGERIGNELKFIGSGITDNFTYSDKVNPRTGQPLTPSQVRQIEGKPKKPVPRTTPGAAAENNPKGVSDPKDKETQRMLSGKPKPAEKKPAGVKPAAQQPTTVTRPAPRVSSPAPKPAAKPSSAQTGNKEADMSTWAKANRKMIEKVGTKAQRELLAKALGGSSTANNQLKVNPPEPKASSNAASKDAMDKNKASIENDKKAQAFTEKVSVEEQRRRERLARARLNGSA